MSHHGSRPAVPRPTQQRDKECERHIMTRHDEKDTTHITCDFIRGWVEARGSKNGRPAKNAVAFLLFGLAPKWPLVAMETEAFWLSTPRQSRTAG